MSTTLQVLGGACCTNIDLVGIVHALWLRNQSIATRWWLSILIRTVDHSGVVALVLVLLQYPRANPCAMPGLGYTQGGPDRAASITDHQHHRIQACKESNGILRLSLSASHSFRGVL